MTTFYLLIIKMTSVDSLGFYFIFGEGLTWIILPTPYIDIPITVLLGYPVRMKWRIYRLYIDGTLDSWVGGPSHHFGLGSVLDDVF